MWAEKSPVSLPLRPFSYYVKQLLLLEARLKQKLSSSQNSRNASKINTYHSTQSCSSWDHSCPACSLIAVSRYPRQYSPQRCCPFYIKEHMSLSSCILVPSPPHPILPSPKCIPRFKVLKNCSLQNRLPNQSTPLAQSQIGTSPSITHASEWPHKWVTTHWVAYNQPSLHISQHHWVTPELQDTVRHLCT